VAHPLIFFSKKESGCPILRAFCEGWETTNAIESMSSLLHLSLHFCLPIQTELSS
jgi:hypothetical protein